MKTVIFSLILSTSNLLLLGASPSWAALASNAKVAELTAHRIDRLVSLGKIDRDFLMRLEKVEVSVVNQGSVAFMVKASQTQQENGNQPMELGLSFDKDGKVLSYQVVAGGTPGPDPQWPDKDAVTLTEDALHYVLDNAGEPEVRKFYNGLKMFVLTKVELNGAVVARGQIHSSLTTDKLNIYVRLDGMFISAEIVP